MALRPHVTACGSPVSQHGHDSARGSDAGTMSSHRDQSGLNRGAGAPTVNSGRGNPLSAPAFNLNTNEAPAGDRRSKAKNTSNDHDDPFVTQTNDKFLNTGKATLNMGKKMAEQKLSPTASTFTPLATQSFAGYGGLDQPSNAPKVSPLDPHPHGTSYINPPSMTESSHGIFAQSRGSPLRAGLDDGATYGGSSNSSYAAYFSRSRLCPGSAGFARTYFDPMITRAIVVTHFDGDAITTIDSIFEASVIFVSLEDQTLISSTVPLSQCCQQKDSYPWSSTNDLHQLLRQAGCSNRPRSSSFLLYTLDVHLYDICRFYDRQSNQPTVLISANLLQKMNPPYGDDFLDDGEIIVEAKYDNDDSRGIDLDVIDEYIVDLLKNNGDISAIKKIDDPKEAAAAFRAEFIDCRDARKAAMEMHGYRVMVGHFIISSLQPSIQRIC
jgi:hypothetical protein